MESTSMRCCLLPPYMWAFSKHSNPPSTIPTVSHRRSPPCQPSPSRRRGVPCCQCPNARRVVMRGLSQKDSETRESFWTCQAPWLLWANSRLKTQLRPQPVWIHLSLHCTAGQNESGNIQSEYDCQCLAFFTACHSIINKPFFFSIWADVQYLVEN